MNKYMVVHRVLNSLTNEYFDPYVDLFISYITDQYVFGSSEDGIAFQIRVPAFQLSTIRVTNFVKPEEDE